MKSLLSFVDYKIEIEERSIKKKFSFANFVHISKVYSKKN